LWQRHVKEIHRQTASLCPASSSRASGVHVGAYLSEQRRPRGRRRQGLIVEGGPGVVFRCRDRLIHAINCLGSNFRGESTQAIRSVAGVEVAEAGMIKRIDEIHSEVKPALSFVAKRDIFRDRKVKEL